MSDSSDAHNLAPRWSSQTELYFVLCLEYIWETNFISIFPSPLTPMSLQTAVSNYGYSSDVSYFGYGDVPCLATNAAWFFLNAQILYYNHAAWINLMPKIRRRIKPLPRENIELFILNCATWKWSSWFGIHYILSLIHQALWLISSLSR